MNINNYIDVLIPTTNKKITIKLLRSKRINLYRINEDNDSLVIKINIKDLEKISKIYDVKIIKYYGFKAAYYYIKNNYLEYIILLLFVCFITIYSWIIIDINITSPNNQLNSTILNELDKQNIVKYSFRKSEIELKNIKENILKNTKDLVEWINIERVGMTYIVKVEPRLNKKIDEEPSYCNIIAKKAGMITKVITISGEEVIEPNMYVQEGDILIKGDIVFNDSLKSQVCSKGMVMAKTWYTINLDIPKYYEKINKTKRKRFNLYVEFKGKNYRLRKSKYNNYIKEHIKTIQIFNIKLEIVKEIETEVESVEYTENELNDKLNELIEKHMNRALGEDGPILERKVLKKLRKADKISVEVFVVAEEQIGISSYS